MSNVKWSRLEPTWSKQAFIRQAWIELAKKDCPIGAFECDFSEIKTIWHMLVKTHVIVDAQATATVGTHVNGKSSWNSKDDEYIWLPFAGQVTADEKLYYIAKKQGYAGNESYLYQLSKFDVERENIGFMRGLKKSSLIESTQDECAELFTQTVGEEVCQKTLLEMNRLGKKGANSAISGHIPGDRLKNLSYTLNSASVEAEIILYPEYEVSLTYKGKTYAKTALPFGERLEFKGENVVDDSGITKQINDLKVQARQSTKIAEEEVPAKVWKALQIPTFISWGLVVLSIILSLAVRSVAVVVIFGILAMGGILVCGLLGKKVEQKTQDGVNESANAITEQANAKILQLRAEYKPKLLEALNGKLEALGYDGVKDLAEEE